jgi:hypothetical protein
MSAAIKRKARIAAVENCFFANMTPPERYLLNVLDAGEVPPACGTSNSCGITSSGDNRLFAIGSAFILIQLRQQYA